MWCIPRITPEYRKRMYDILKLYAEPYDPEQPVIGLDEKPKQLLGEKRKPLRMKPGMVGKYDYEYVRKGSANIFVAVEPKGGKRIAQVTPRRTKRHFAEFVRRLVDTHYADAKLLRLVADNLNTHNASAFSETFGEREARRILKRIEFHYTPTHASWLNVAEIEIGVMDAQCTDRRIPDMETLAVEVRAWAQRRNRQRKKIDWRFTRSDADKKLGKHYVT